MSTVRYAAMPTALIVERQRLMLPFLEAVVADAGFRSVRGSATQTTFSRVRPDAIVLGIDLPGSRPLDVVRRTRAANVAATIVVITGREDTAWNALARALGADVVLGPQADGNALAAALAG